MTQVLSTGDENAGQEMNLPVPGRASPLRVRAIDGTSLGALIPPLSTVIFADANTAVPVAEQNGSIAAPFASLAAAIAEVPDAFANGRTIMLTPGDYGAPVPIGSKSITFMGLAQPGSLDQPTIQVEPDASSVYFQNVSVFFDAVNSPTIELLNCQAGGEAGAALVVARQTVFTGQTTNVGLLRAFECDVNILTGDEATLDECHLSGDITITGTLTIRNVRTVQPGLTISATSIVVDSHTLRELVFAGTTLTGTVTGYSGAVFSWGALVANNNEFFNVGTRANAATTPTEDIVRFFASRRGVLCSMHGFAVVNPSTLTLRVNSGNTPLAVSPNGGEAHNGASFVEVQQGDTITLMFTGTSGDNSVASVVFV